VNKFRSEQFTQYHFILTSIFLFCVILTRISQSLCLPRFCYWHLVHSGLSVNVIHELQYTYGTVLSGQGGDIETMSCSQQLCYILRCNSEEVLLENIFVYRLYCLQRRTRRSDIVVLVQIAEALIAADKLIYSFENKHIACAVRLSC
jgi:hypothetical protein